MSLLDKISVKFNENPAKWTSRDVNYQSDNGLRHHAGFTLLEIMIVIALIGLISLIAYPNFRSLREDQTLYAEATKIKGDIRYMQQIAFDTQNTCRMTYGTQSYIIQLDAAPNPLKNEKLESNVKFQGSGTLEIGGNGIPIGNSTVTITLVKNDFSVDIKILPGGKIEII